MSLQLLPVQDAISAHLRELPQTVYENTAPADELLEYSNGTMLPFIVPIFGGYSRAIQGRGITSVRDDLGETYVTVACVGPTERSARQVADLVLDKLTGFKPVNASELTPASNTGTLVFDNSIKPVKYISEITFVFYVNTHVIS
jgi:hypothetical protein